MANSKILWISENSFYKAIDRQSKVGNIYTYNVGAFEVLYSDTFTYAKCFHDPDCCLRFSPSWSRDSVISYLENFNYDDYWFRKFAPW